MGLAGLAVGDFASCESIAKNEWREFPAIRFRKRMAGISRHSFLLDSRPKTTGTRSVPVVFEPKTTGTGSVPVVFESKTNGTRSLPVVFELKTIGTRSVPVVF